MQELYVDLGERSYPIYIGSNLLSQPGYLTSHIHGHQVAVVTNETIAPLYLEKLCTHLHELNPIVVTLPDGEKYKNLDILNRIFDQLLQSRHNRKTTLIALGGGVIGDMTGFAAACYQRGVDFIQIPTTLLSQVDSSVGGKTGVNHALGKNMIGAFYQPNAVIIDTETLSTLPNKELSAGIAEVIKYGLICDKPFYNWLHDNMDKLLERDNDALSYAILRSCQNKADVVAEDEKESGIRAILNLGHTFGHAIETYTGYGSWLHGEAVAVGMVMAADLSLREGDISKEEYRGLVELIEKANLPVEPPAGMTPEHFIELMSVDKKVLDGQLRLVLLKEVGVAVVTQDFNLDNLRATLNAFCS
ncbi:3-dehydroquinate synthase [Endozoicomonas ascidiicola]|uniref:3-dehydroquinate synthase n=1 Tax=Endozoicomonas ascidiicola TaxID=1698521 RepID=UPI0008358963|nr:3-dehydroquinate synthase [Endozoicomonas ascidiicola]